MTPAYGSVKPAALDSNQLAQLLQCPFGWDDLILPVLLKEDIRDFVFEAQHRIEFWERKEAQRSISTRPRTDRASQRAIRYRKNHDCPSRRGFAWPRSFSH